MNELIETKIEDETLYVYNITPENINLLNIPEGINQLHIKGYYLDHFNIPLNLTDVYIDYIGLKTLYIPNGTKYVNCSRNFLQTIEIPSSLITLIANKNLLQEITFRSLTDNQLNYLDIRSNKMTKLDFDIPDCMDYFNASMNKINYIAPKIGNYLSMQYLSAPSSPSSSDDEDWYNCKFRKFSLQ